jgi:hypothetical protein
MIKLLILVSFCLAMSIPRGVLGDDHASNDGGFVLLRVDRAQVCSKVCSDRESDMETLPGNVLYKMQDNP